MRNLLSLIYKLIMRTRVFLYSSKLLRSHKLDIPIISIGNLSMGGTGKTPFTLFIAKFLESKNYEGVILSRGYKSKLESRGGIIRSDDNDVDPKEFGDEPVMVQRNLSKTDIIIGKRRYENFINLQSKKYDYAILDDGFQHLKIKRNLNILLIDLSMDPKKFRALPLGALREPKAASSRADLIVLTKKSKAKPSDIAFYKKYFHGENVIDVDFKVCGVFNRQGETINLNARELKLISGIARNEHFKSEIENLGGKIIEHLCFQDHDDFNDLSINLNEKAILVCTEKDFVKLNKKIASDNLYYVKIETIFHHGEKLLKQKISNLFP